VKVLAVGASTATQQANRGELVADASAGPPVNSGVADVRGDGRPGAQIINANQGGGLLVLLPPDQSEPTTGAAKASASSK